MRIILLALLMSLKKPIEGVVSRSGSVPIQAHG